MMKIEKVRRSVILLLCVGVLFSLLSACTSVKTTEQSNSDHAAAQDTADKASAESAPRRSGRTGDRTRYDSSVPSKAGSAGRIYADHRRIP